MPSFAKVELREGRIFGMTNRGDVYEIRIGWDDLPEIRLLARGNGRVSEAWPPLAAYS